MSVKGEPKVNDKLLLLQLKSGSKGAFATLYDHYWNTVYATAFKRLQDADLAKDVTQDVFLQIWAKRDILEIENLPAYLHTAARNKVFNIFEKQRRFTPVSDLFESLAGCGEQADAELLKKEFLRAYEAFLESLPAVQRTIFRMRFDKGLSTEEIAAALHLSRKTVQNNLSLVGAHLRSSLTTTVILLVFFQR